MFVNLGLDLMKLLLIGVVPVATALLLSACGGATHTAALPVSTGGILRAPVAHMTVAEKRARLAAAVARDRTVPMDQEIAEAASHGQSVFRYKQLMIFRPATARDVHRDAERVDDDVERLCALRRNARARHAFGRRSHSAVSALHVFISKNY